MDNLGNSIRYSIAFLERNLSIQNSGLFGETVIQILRDYYLLKKGSFLTGGIGLVLDEFGLDIHEHARSVLMGIERSLRNEEDYNGLSGTLTMVDMREILSILKGSVK